MRPATCLMGNTAPRALDRLDLTPKTLLLCKSATSSLIDLTRTWFQSLLQIKNKIYRQGVFCSHIIHISKTKKIRIQLKLALQIWCVRVFKLSSGKKRFKFVFFCLFLREGVNVPMGPVVTTGMGKQKNYTLLYNEFVIYNPAQIRMRYLLRIKFNYSTLW